MLGRLLPSRSRSMVMAQPRVSHDTSEAAVSFTLPSSSSSMDTTITPISIHPLTDPSKHVADDIYTSNISGKSLNSERVGEKIAVEGMTEGIIIGMDNNDAATVGPETIESRASSSSTDHRRPSETNDTDHDEPETNDEYTLNNIKNNNKENYPSSMRRSSSTGERQIVRIRLGDHSRSPSSNSAVSSTSLHRNRSSSSYSKTHPQRTGRPRKLSSLDPPDTTTHTTITSETGSQHPSVTEFQKYPGQLHSFSTGAIDPERQEWQLQPNPHRPKTNTEILRIERAYTPIALPTKSRVSGVANYDVLIPRFSPSYPPVLRDYGVSEEEWGTFIQRVNKSCMEAFDPFRFSNIIVNILAVLTLWFSELIIPNLAKKVWPSLSSINARN